jgi:ribonucleotide reductase alpha subunit
VKKKILETMYHASLEASWEMARERKYTMQLLKELHDKMFFEFEDPDDPICRKYVIHDEANSDVIYSHTHSRTLPLKVVLDEFMPTPGELAGLEPDHMGAYSTFEGSPASQGILQFDMWKNVVVTDRYDWKTLKDNIRHDGIRNSLLVAPMPTASTSQILGNNECFEPFTSNIYTRRTIAGEFVVINKYLLRELIDLGMWNKDVKNHIIYHKGSVQNLDGLPKRLKDKYKIVWEMPMKSLIEMSRDRGAFICQSQSMNLWMANPDYTKLTAMHFFAWSQGLKTGIYYLRTKAKAAAQQFTIDPVKNVISKSGNGGEEEEEVCEMCSG